MKPQIAIVGGGVAGLSAAYRLRNDAAITIFEREGYSGGHARTIEVDEQGTQLGIDTAFMVFNAYAYPQLCAFFAELGVASCDHDGGFTFFDCTRGIEFGTPELGLPKEQLSERYSPAFCTMIEEVQRFFREGPRDFVRRRANMPLGAYLEANGYSEDFKHGYMVLLATAVWSIPPERIWQMPASTLIAFFMSHDEGGLGGQRVAWKTVAGGSINYLRAALAAIKPDLRLGKTVVSVRAEGAGVVVTTADGQRTRFDQVVVAAHADDALALLENPPQRVRELLSLVEYNDGHVVLHCDERVMPRSRERWASWNYGKQQQGGEERSYVAYYMNKIHGFQAKKQYFLTLDYPGPIEPSSVLLDTMYRHPIITQAVRDMQNDIYGMNALGPVKYCGSYFHARKIGPDLIGSHEAGFSSGVEAALAVLRDLRARSAGAELSTSG